MRLTHVVDGLIS